MLRKHSLVINGRSTAVAIEDVFWNAAKVMAADKKITLISLLENTDLTRGEDSLPSALRCKVLQHFIALASGEGR